MRDKDMFVCSYPDWQEKRENTTFWSDFTIADAFGDAAIRDTFKVAFSEWKSHYKYLTELITVLNHKCWQHHERGNSERSELYLRLYEEASAWAEANLKDDESKFYFMVTD